MITYRPGMKPIYEFPDVDPNEDKPAAAKSDPIIIPAVAPQPLVNAELTVEQAIASANARVAQAAGAVPAGTPAASAEVKSEDILK